MLRGLSLVDVGPTQRLSVELGARLNVFAGDNGLGKSFVLDVVWWALTGTWGGLPAWPRGTEGAAPEIAVDIDRAAATALAIVDDRHLRDDVSIHGEVARLTTKFNFTTQEWRVLALCSASSAVPALVVSARADGSFAVWDPARNHHMLRSSGMMGVNDTETASNPAVLRRPPAYVFTPHDLWNGLESHGKTLCNGLIRDWVSWQRQASPIGAPDGTEGEFSFLCRLLRDLSPHPDRSNEVLRPGPPVRVFVDDSRDFPTVDIGYGNVPVIHTSAAMRRILGLAYLVVWSWREHLAASKLLRRPPVEHIVFLMDEVENHLHPAWQRRIVPALLSVFEGLGPSMSVQAYLTTHAPLVLASLEPIFDAERDRFFVFDLDAEHGNVTLDEVPWTKQGDATDWLTSQVFKLDQARSVDAERAIEDAEAFMRGDEPLVFKTRGKLDAELHRVLSGDDVFWPRWIGADRRGSHP